MRSWQAFTAPGVAYLHARDWLLVVRRPLADAALGGALALYHNCSGPGPGNADTPEDWLRLAIRHGGGVTRVEPFAVGLVGVEPCSAACPLHAAPPNASDPRQRRLVRNASQAFVGYLNGECPSISGFVGCFGAAVLSCRSAACEHAVRSPQLRGAFVELARDSITDLQPTWRGLSL